MITSSTAPILVDIMGTVGGAMVASQYSMKGGVYGRIATVRLSSRGVEV